MDDINPQQFKEALLNLLGETYENVQGYYLDRGTSLFETLHEVSAAEASIPVGGKCATLAAQVKHVAFYLNVLENSIRDPQYPNADWGEIWRTLSSVTPQEWQDIQDELRVNYNQIVTLIENTNSWPDADAIGNIIASIVHSAYHLGEIRQALCTLKS
jgi:hypothetical protein